MPITQRPALAVLLAACVWLPPASARACGGFFCNNIDPVVQTAERILFRINDDATITTIVEIQYEGPPSQFGWVLPVAPGLTTDDIETAPAGLFDALEQRMAPVFERPQEGASSPAADEGSGCGGGDDNGYGFEGDPLPPDISGVQVVGEAVVGPYAVEIITAEQGENLSNWLLINGYQIPQSAIGAMDHYIGMKMAFLGLKLQADVPAGPIDALAFTYKGTVPSIPVVLTAVAAAADMEIVAYIAGPGRYVPDNYIDLEFNYQSVRWTGEDETDYLLKLSDAVDAAGGRAWNTEYAARLGKSGEDITDTVLAEVLMRDDYVTRFHTFMSAEDMTADPYWVPRGMLADIDNHHTLYDGYSADVRPARDLAALGILPVLLLLPRRRRIR
jgi:hypothetical protein